MACPASSCSSFSLFVLLLVCPVKVSDAGVVKAIVMCALVRSSESEGAWVVHELSVPSVNGNVDDYTSLWTTCGEIDDSDW